MNKILSKDKSLYIMKRNSKYWLKLFTELNAFWEHSGDSNDPHALLTKGGHSGGFINSKIVILDLKHGPNLCSDIFTSLRQWGLQHTEISCVVGPASGATKLAEMMAALITECRSKDIPACRSYSPEKVGEGLDQRMEFPNDVPQAGDIVLLVEDTITTCGSAQLAIEAIKNCGAAIYPLVGVAANRSGEPTLVLDDDVEIPIVGLVNKHLPNWSPEDCPLCVSGSEAIRPKEGTNWVDYFTMTS